MSLLSSLRDRFSRRPAPPVQAPVATRAGIETGAVGDRNVTPGRPAGNPYALMRVFVALHSLADEIRERVMAANDPVYRDTVLRAYVELGKARIRAAAGRAFDPQGSLTDREALTELELRKIALETAKQNWKRALEERVALHDKLAGLPMPWLMVDAGLWACIALASWAAAEGMSEVMYESLGVYIKLPILQDLFPSREAALQAALDAGQATSFTLARALVILAAVVAVSGVRAGGFAKITLISLEATAALALMMLRAPSLADITPASIAYFSLEAGVVLMHALAMLWLGHKLAARYDDRVAHGQARRAFEAAEQHESEAYSAVGLADERLDAQREVVAVREEDVHDRPELETLAEAEVRAAYTEAIQQLAGKRLLSGLEASPTAQPAQA